VVFGESSQKSDRMKKNDTSFLDTPRIKELEGIVEGGALSPYTGAPHRYDNESEEEYSKRVEEEIKNQTEWSGRKNASSITKQNS